VQQTAMLGTQELVSDSAIQPSQERIEETGDVEQTNRLGVQP
jgi:hypothetical protein